MGRVTAQATRVFVPWTARVTARPKTGKRQTGSSRVELVVLPFLALLFIFFLPMHAAVAANENDVVLPGSGIHYPGGFDMNTVGILQGKAYGIHVPEKGPVQFLVATWLLRGAKPSRSSPPLPGSGAISKETQLKAWTSRYEVRNRWAGTGNSI